MQGIALSTFYTEVAVVYVLFDLNGRFRFFWVEQHLVVSVVSVVCVCVR